MVSVALTGQLLPVTALCHILGDHLATSASDDLNRAQVKEGQGTREMMDLCILP